MGSRKGRRGPGLAPLTEKRDAFAHLIERGVSNSEACRLVGVNRRTGTRWRYGRTVAISGGGSLHYQDWRRETGPCHRAWLTQGGRLDVLTKFAVGSYAVWVVGYDVPWTSRLWRLNDT